VPNTTPEADANTIATMSIFFLDRFIKRNDRSEIIPNTIINVCDSTTSDNTNNKADNRPKIKKLTDKPSLYNVIIKAIRTRAKPVSS
jgi:hypothetical protein